MKYFTRALVFWALIFSSCLSSDGDLKELPDATLASVTFTDSGGKKITGTLEYDGNPLAPGKITVAWSGDLHLLQIPLKDSKTITKTIYEFSEGRIIKIININSDDVIARTDDFTYDASGFLTTHELREINVGGAGFFTYTNTFSYDDGYDPQKAEYDRVGGGVSSVTQVFCNNSGSCINGQFTREDAYTFISAIPSGSAADQSTFRNGRCEINRSAGDLHANFELIIPNSALYTNVFGLPDRIGDPTYAPDGLVFTREEAELFAQIYYVVGQWINPAYFRLDEEAYYYSDDNHPTHKTYGRDNSSWIFPRLNMATSYSAYQGVHGELEGSEHRMTVKFHSKVID
jgi:hypothetical protein